MSTTRLAGALKNRWCGLSGGEFTAMDVLNTSAHASFPVFLTAIDVVSKPDYPVASSST
jgi:hypothetical protein